MQFTYVFYFFELFLYFCKKIFLIKLCESKISQILIAIRLCLPDDVTTTVMTSATGLHYNTCFPISFGTCTSCCSCHLKSLTSWKLFCYSQLFFCSWPDCVRPLPLHGNSPCHGVSRHLYLWISFWHKRIVWQNVLTFYSPAACSNTARSEEHTSELQSPT